MTSLTDDHEMTGSAPGMHERDTVNTAGGHAVAAAGVTKRYGTLTALRDVSVAFPRGAVHALLGENGAGKSTLAKIIAGVARPQQGSITIGGRPVELGSARTALRYGIGMVPQHPSLITTMSVVENALYGHDASSGWLVSRSRARVELQQVADRLGFDVALDVKVERLSLGERQRAEIVRLLRRKATTLILDEPTDVLTPEEGTMLFTAMRRFVEGGGTVIVITHRMVEVFDGADTVTVLRDGCISGTPTTPVAHVTEDKLVEWMLGRVYSAPATRSRAPSRGAARLEAIELSSQGRIPVRQASLRVDEGEIVGIAGVDGNGQEDLAGILSGTIAARAGRVRLKGEDVTHLDVMARRSRGLAYVPADRHHEGLVLSLSVGENLCLRDLVARGSLARYGLVRLDVLRARARKLVDEFEIKCASIDSKVSSLSGGNQQKVVLAREASSDPVVMIAAQPTRGLDVGARDFLHRRLRRLADQGTGVVLISSDLDEIMTLSDRIAVLARGEITGEFTGPEYDVAEIGKAMVSTRRVTS